MLRNVITVLVLALSATASSSAINVPLAAHTGHSSAGLSSRPSRYANAGLHHHPGVRTPSHTRRAKASASRATAHRRPSASAAHARVMPAHHHVTARHASERVATNPPSPSAEAASYRLPRYMPMPPPLTGSLESLERQNRRTEDDGLERILDEKDLSERIAQRLLVPIPASSALEVNPELRPTHRYCRPWTARFLADFARAHAVRFHTPLRLSSAVRTVTYQKQLIQVNGNAAAAEGDIVSPHLTGATIDIAKSFMSRSELAWVRAWLLHVQSAGRIDVEEEFQQACFHITVYKSYVPARPVPHPQRPHAHPLPEAELASSGR